MNQFKKDPRYLLNYCIINIILFLSFNIALYLFNGISFNFNPSTGYYFLPLISIFLCGLPSSILHNCAHGNIKPFWLNQLVGELCGLFMLYGFKGFQVAHMYHHIYPDNPNYDPHPPRGYSFLRFVISPIEATLVILKRGYLETFGDTEQNNKILNLQTRLFNVKIALKVIFLYLLLGPELFILGYLPIYLSNIFIFAHINYAGHIENEDGSSEIIDLDNNAYYKFVNIVSLGGYYHKSHHLKPQFMNPSKVRNVSNKRVITYTPVDVGNIPPRKPLFHLGLIHGLKGIKYVE